MIWAEFSHHLCCWTHGCLLEAGFQADTGYSYARLGGYLLEWQYKLRLLKAGLGPLSQRHRACWSQPLLVWGLWTLESLPHELRGCLQRKATWRGSVRHLSWVERMVWPRLLNSSDWMPAEWEERVTKEQWCLPAFPSQERATPAVLILEPKGLSF